jgi:hypothetical protein
MALDEANSDKPSSGEPTEPVAPSPGGCGIWGCLAVILVGVLACYLLLFAMKRLHIFNHSTRMTSSNNLKQIGLAFHNYYDANSHFPTNSYSPTGEPLLSWRVHILPYVEQGELYEKFKLDEPWDSSTNKPLLAQMPKTYASPNEDTHQVGMSYYRGFSQPGTILEQRTTVGMRNKSIPLGLKLEEVHDGLLNTIFVVEAGEAVEWTRPEDLDGSGPFPKLGGLRPKSDIVNVLFGDGAVKGIKKTVPETVWRGATTYQGGEVVVWE